MFHNFFLYLYIFTTLNIIHNRSLLRSPTSLRFLGSQKVRQCLTQFIKPNNLHKPSPKNSLTLSLQLECRCSPRSKRGPVKPRVISRMNNLGMWWMYSGIKVSFNKRKATEFFLKCSRGICQPSLIPLSQWKWSPHKSKWKFSHIFFL